MLVAYLQETARRLSRVLILDLYPLQTPGLPKVSLLLLLNRSLPQYRRPSRITNDYTLTEAFDKEVSACRNALFLTDPYIDRESLISAKGKRVDGTYEWIRENDTY